MGIVILISSIVFLALFAAYLIKDSNKGKNSFKLSKILPFTVSFAVSAASLILALFVTGYELYFITALMIWFIFFGIVKAVQIIGYN